LLNQHSMELLTKLWITLLISYQNPWKTSIYYGFLWFWIKT